MHLDEYRTRLESRIADATAMSTMAPVADVLRLIVDELAEVPAVGRRGAAPQPDRLLTAKAVAERLGVQPRWVYDRADELPFTRRLSGNLLRFSERALERYLAARPS